MDLAELHDAPEKLRLLARWHDLYDSSFEVGDAGPERGNEVQRDLRRWADVIDSLLAAEIDEDD